MRNIKYIGLSLVTALGLGFSGCGDSGSSSANVLSSNSTSIFDRATLINLGDLTDYSLITTDSGASNLKRSVAPNDNSENSNERNNIALKLTNNTANSIKISLLNLKQSNDKKSSLARAVTQNGDIKTVDDVENGNISGDKTLHLDVNMITGALSGSIIYKNYKNSESDSCGANETTSMVGAWNVTGTMDLVTSEVLTLNLSTNSNLYIDEIIIKSGMTMTIAYNRTSLFEEDAITTGTFEATQGNEEVGYKDFQERSYSYNGYEYSYPVSGNLYIFTNELNGYFSVDASYDHSLTPTKKDICEIYTYSGKEHYVGKDKSTLEWVITSTNNYKIDIDRNNDGVIDKSFTGVE